MRDLLVITPTRGRQASAQRLIDAMASTTALATDLILAVDDDDPSYRHLELNGNVITARGPRMTCPQWTNLIARDYAGQYRALASLGDDHVPETPGWDALLLKALREMGGTGIAYGNDCLQGERLPTAPVVSSDIVTALGWFMYPGCRYVYCDNVWLDLGRAAGCLKYVPRVIIRHLHWSAGTAPRDQTYAERDGDWGPDEQAWLAWQRHQMPRDVGKIRALIRADSAVLPLPCGIRMGDPAG